MHSGDPQLVLRGELGLTVAKRAWLAGGKNPANVELMPAAVRCTGLAVAFNLAEGYFGITPLTSTWLISRTSNPLLPGAWVALAGADHLDHSSVLHPRKQRSGHWRRHAESAC